MINYLNFLLFKETIEYIFQCKETWPSSFRKTSQEFINGLNLGLDNDFLLQPNYQDRLSKLVDFVQKRRRSKIRERSESPSGARNMKDNIWETNAEIAVFIIDQIMLNIQCISFFY